MKFSKIIYTSLLGFSLLTLGCSKSINALDEDLDLDGGEGSAGDTSAGEAAGGESGTETGEGTGSGGGKKIGTIGMDIITKGGLVKGDLIGKLDGILGGLKHEAGSSVLTISLEKISRYKSNIFDESATEIVVYDKTTKKVFVVDSSSESQIRVLSLNNDGELSFKDSIKSPSGTSPNSVATFEGLVAVAYEAEVKQDNGFVTFYDAESLEEISSVTVGPLPDMLKFTPDGSKVLVANEGEPDFSYENDPEGSVSIIDVSSGAENLSQSDVKTLGFEDYNSKKQNLIDEGAHIAGPEGTTVAQDLEPEYIAISEDSKTAWVTLQENNAIAVLDLNRGKIKDVYGLGFKDHSEEGNGFDPNDTNGAKIDVWPVYGMYQPDTIASYEVDGKNYIVTANEGDPRDDNDFEEYNEQTRVKDLDDEKEVGIDNIKGLDSDVFESDMDESGSDGKLGRLYVCNNTGINEEGYFEALYSFGTRSFSIWSEDVEQVYDSGDEFEQTTLAQLGEGYFNVDNNEDIESDARSDKNGPSPEALAVGQVGDKYFAFIGLEKQGGIMVYDITDPKNSSFVEYVQDRDYEVNPEDMEDGKDPGDLGPEGYYFISSEDSPTHKPLLLTANEVSGTVTVYKIEVTYEE